MAGNDSAAAMYLLDTSIVPGTLRPVGGNYGIAYLDSTGVLPAGLLPSTVFQLVGTWNASTDTPHLAGTTPAVGTAYYVAVAGSTTLGSTSSWQVGDFAVCGSSGWFKIASGGVMSFNARTGAVVPVAGDYDGLSLNLAAAGSFVVPSGAGAAPTTAAQVAYDSTANKVVYGKGASTDTVLSEALAASTYQPLDADLTALAGVSSTGLLGRTGSGTAAARSITGTSNLITVTNGDGVGGNPTITVGGNVYQVGGTDVAVADGGTGASTAAGARDGIVWAGAGAIDPASPYTVAAGIDRITLASSKTIAPRALSNYVDGQPITVINSSASAITVTIAPADGTIDGASSVAISVPAHGTCGCVRLSSSTWGSVQPGGVSTTTRAIRMAVADGALGAREYALSASGWVSVGAVVAATVEAGSSAEVTFSGANATIKAGIGTGGGAAVYSSPYRAYVALSNFSSVFQGLFATGAMMTLEVKYGAMDVGVATAQAGVVLTGGLSGALSTSGESFMVLVIREGVTAPSARTLPGLSSALSNMPTTSGYAQWSGRYGLGLSSSNAEMTANTTSGSSSVASQTQATAPTYAGDALYFCASGVTSSPLVDVLWTAPEFWFILAQNPVVAS